MPVFGLVECAAPHAALATLPRGLNVDAFRLGLQLVATRPNCARLNLTVPAVGARTFSLRVVFPAALRAAVLVHHLLRNLRFSTGHARRLNPRYRLSRLQLRVVICIGPHAGLFPVSPSYGKSLGVAGNISTVGAPNRDHSLVVRQRALLALSAACCLLGCAVCACWLSCLCLYRCGVWPSSHARAYVHA